MAMTSTNRNPQVVIDVDVDTGHVQSPDACPDREPLIQAAGAMVPYELVQHANDRSWELMFSTIRVLTVIIAVLLLLLGLKNGGSVSVSVPVSVPVSQAGPSLSQTFDIQYDPDSPTYGSYAPDGSIRWPALREVQFLP